MSIEFLNTDFFWAITAIPILFGATLWGLRRRSSILNDFGNSDLLTQFSRFSSNRKIPCYTFPAVLCFALLVAVAARPLLLGKSGTIKQGSLDVVAVLDLSRSMAAEDYGPKISRLETAKEIVLRSMQELEGNRLGIITFAGDIFPQAELTDDFQALTFVLKNWINLDSAPSQGSDIGHALSGAVELFGNEDRKKIILLCSDGGHARPKNLNGILTDIATRGISVVTVGLGSTIGSKIPVYEDGRFKEWFKLEGKEVVTQLNEEILREISGTTGGKYFQADRNTKLKYIFRDPGVLGETALSGGKEIFQIPLALSIGLLFWGLCFERLRE